MVEVRIIKFVGHDTVFTAKLSVTGESKERLGTGIGEELLFLFLAPVQLNLEPSKGASTEKPTEELWLGVGRIIEIRDKFLVIRYLPIAPDVAIVGHAIYRPATALVVLASPGTEFHLDRQARIDRRAFAELKALRKLICPNRGCLLLREQERSTLCETCLEARRAKTLPLVWTCQGCGQELPLGVDPCPRCRAHQTREKKWRAAWTKMASWDERDEEDYSQRHGGG